MTRVLWTEEEDKILHQCVSENKTNIREASRKCSALIGRPATACAARWYYISAKEKDKKKGIDFLMTSKKDSLPNRKVIRTGTKCPIEPIKHKKGYWKNLLDALLGKQEQ